MVEQLSPLAPVIRYGRFGRTDGEAGVSLSEAAPGSIVQVTVWPGGEQAAIDAIWKLTGLELSARPGHGVVARSNAGFGIGPGRFLLVDDEEGLEQRLRGAIPGLIGAVTDLTHGRTAIRIAGPKAEWVLAKLFAIDFSAAAFPLSHGVATKHHEIFAQIHRTAADGFDIYVFRSFARSFWKALRHAAEEVGYDVA